MTIQDRIRTRLETLEMSATHASKAAGLGETFLKDFFAGRKRSLSVENLQQLALVLETTTEYLISGKGDEQKPEAAEVFDIFDRILDKEEREAWMQMGRAIASKKKKSGED